MNRVADGGSVITDCKRAGLECGMGGVYVRLESRLSTETSAL